MDSSLNLTIQFLLRLPGWPHLVAWIPVLIVNTLVLSTDSIGMVRWQSDGYQKARFVAVLFNTITLGISCLFDAVDTYRYYVVGQTSIERSSWTISELLKYDVNASKRGQD